MKNKILVVLVLLPTLVLAQPGSSYEIAIKKYTDQIQHSTTDDQAKLYLQRGLTYLQIKDYSKAAEDLQKYIEKRADNRYWSSAMYNLGFCQEKLHQDREALATYAELLTDFGKKEIIDGKISWNDIMLHRIQLLKKQDLWYSAVKDLKNLSTTEARAASDSILRVNKIVAALQTNLFDLLKIEDSRRISIAEKFTQQGALAGALSASMDEINDVTSPNRVAARLIRGYLLMAVNNFKEANFEFDAVDKQSTDYNLRGLAHYYGSFVKEKLGDRPGAITAIQLAGKMFTSERSMVPASQVVAQMKSLGVQPLALAQANTQADQRHDEGVKKADTVKTIKDKSNLKKPEPVKSNSKEIVKETKPAIEAENKPVVTNAKVLTGSALRVADLTKQIAADPNNMTLYLQRGIVFYQDNQFSTALIDINNYLKFGEDKSRSKGQLYSARCYEKLNQLDKAVAIYYSLQTSITDSELSSLGIQRNDLYLSTASISEKQQNLFRALNDYQKASALDPLNRGIKTKVDSIFILDPLYKMISTYSAFNALRAGLSKRLLESEQAFKNGDLESCKILATEELNRGNATGTALLIRGFANMASKSYESAVQDFQNSASNNPNIEQKGLINFYQSFCYQKLNNSDEAINHISESIKIFTSDKSVLPYTTLLLARADLFEKQGFNAEAVKDYDLYLAQRPGDSKVRQRRDGLGKTVTASAPVEVKPNLPIKTQEPAAKNEPSLRDVFKGEKRYALIIGNSEYSTDIGKLINPGNDAEDLKTVLEKSDFEVVLLKNVTFRQIEGAANNFYKKLSEGPKDQTVGLFYYSGHGVQYEGQNYIVPTDAQVTVPEDIRYVCYPADKILGKMEFANTRMNIIILDACRSNPFPIASREVSTGLAQSRAAKGSYIAYATAPGSTASDGKGRNGLYTQELLKAMQKPGLSIEQVFKEVRSNVSRLSEGRQSTWDNSNIVGEFYFKLDK